MKVQSRSEAAAQEILRNALAVAAEEASIVIVKSAYSTFIVEGADAAAAILDARGQLLAQSLATSLSHGASLRMSLRSILEQFPVDVMRPGELYAMNDVYKGGIHANDIVVVRPIFVDGVVQYFTGSVIHVGDLGGDSAGGVNAGAREVYSEGLQLPPVRIATADGIVDEIARILALNSRTPDNTLGDVRALIAGCNVAARRLEALVAQHGAAEFARKVANFLDYTETRVRAGIDQLPDGRYHGEYVIDDDGLNPGSHMIRVAVTVAGDGLTVDFTGTDPQVSSAINCGYSQTMSAAMFAVRCFLEGTIPMNEGCFRPIEFVLPYGSMVNPSPPHPAGGRNFVMCATIDAIIHALSAAVPEHAIAASGLLQSLCLAPASASQNSWIHMSYEFGGLGGRQGSDGPDATGIHFGLSRNTVPQVEPLEAKVPFVIEAKRFIPGSGGAGRWRGGLGSETVIRLLEPAVLTMRGDRMVNPPPGRNGGKPGRPGGYFKRAVDGQVTQLPNKSGGIRFAPGEALIVRTSGGGGLGDPRERDPDAVRADVRSGRLSPDDAREDYGVEAEAATAGAAAG